MTEATSQHMLEHTHFVTVVPLHLWRSAQAELARLPRTLATTLKKLWGLNIFSLATSIKRITLTRNSLRGLKQDENALKRKKHVKKKPKCNTAKANFKRVYLLPAGGRSHKAAGSLLTDGFEGAAVRDGGTFFLPWLAGASALVHISVCSRSALPSDPWRPSPLQWVHQGCRAPGSAAGVPELPALQSARTEGRKLKTGDQDHASITRRDGKRWHKTLDNGVGVWITASRESHERGEKLVWLRCGQTSGIVSRRDGRQGTNMEAGDVWAKRWLRHDV